MNVYTRIDGKLASYVCDTDDFSQAQLEVRLNMIRHRLPAHVELAVINGGRDSFYFASEWEEKHPPVHHTKADPR